MISILYEDKQKEGANRRKTAAGPVALKDLNLDQVLARITEDWGPEVREIYENLPKDRETQAYRRAIFAELKGQEMLPELLKFLNSLRSWEECRNRAGRAQEEGPGHAWFIREGWCYVSALEDLKAALENRSLISAGLLGLREDLKKMVSTEEYRVFRRELESLWGELQGFRVRLTFEKERFTLEEGKGQGAYGAFLAECFPEHMGSFKSPFLASEELSDLEGEVLRIFQKQHKEFFRKAGELWKKREGYLNEEILCLRTEIAFYASYLSFMQKMQEEGYGFCTPEDTKSRLCVRGLYDLALALNCMEDGREVVPNDALLQEGEGFYVLTGPNQGGKTTFARSLGQLIYFAKLGVDVPARRAEVPYFCELLTHFSVEESSETGRGKLLDELERLKPMLGQEKTGAFVVINELFTTAANYDACIMGKRVLEAFLAKGCRGIYVTHLSELAKAGEGIVSLRAMVDERQLRTYRIERSAAGESAGAVRQAEKYHLTYEQIKERFSCR